MTNQRFEALSRICLNNWHYITKKTLTFSEGINFFTGHSGSGKSTVIDAMQIVLYANSDGRSFFNKAAADDSDRNLIEYLRGMVNIGDNDEFKYLRNQNFSTTIVLELTRTDNREAQCVGVVFDVDTSTNDISRLFFWHKGQLFDNEYRVEDRAMTIAEMKSYLAHNYQKDEYFAGSHNERFRKQLYDIYLGGLDAEKFPLLFKRAIPFRMNLKLEDFVKEYICTEQDIHIEDMQESVMQYGRMRKKIEDTCGEIEDLKNLGNLYEQVEEKKQEQKKYQYFSSRMEIGQTRARYAELQDKLKLNTAELEHQQTQKASVENEIAELTAQGEELFKQIASTGYENLKEKYSALGELLEHLGNSQSSWETTAGQLKVWADQDVTSNRTIWDIEEFEEGTIGEEGLERLKHDLEELKKDVEKQRLEASGVLRDLAKKTRQAQEEYDQLRLGNKAYPKDLEYARSYIQRRLLEENGKSIQVEILADLIDMKSDTWRNAVEGYLANNKLMLVVEPKHARMAMEIYQELDRKQYSRVAVLDTEKVSKDEHQVLDGALAEEVTVRAKYVQSYIDYQLGKVIKCDNVDQLRDCRIGITADCVLYHSYRIQFINPDYYTKSAYIGKNSLRQRIRLLEQQLNSWEEERKPQEDIIKECEAILKLESLSQPVSVYMGWKKDMADAKQKRKEQKKLWSRLEELKQQNVDEWEKERQAKAALCDSRKAVLAEMSKGIMRLELAMDNMKQQAVGLNEILVEKERQLEMSRQEVQNWQLWDQDLASIIGDQTNIRYDRLQEQYARKLEQVTAQETEAWNSLLEARGEYAKKYPNRNFGLSTVDNQVYEELRSRLECDNLEEYRKKASEQAVVALEQFKDDFMFKIRSAIKEALQCTDELNRILNKLDFGKDRYQFSITKNLGADGRYYDMFMDEALEINPAQLNNSYDNQLNLFTMEHQDQYGDMINELIEVFIPPEHATNEQLEEAKRNMDKYSDYRTYLSFDMQQIIQNDDGVMRIGLSKMIRKNSGGEGQNPLYVALLASFAQAYRINLSPKLQRNPTIRLVVLDEAFSKMDAEKVASCIELIRGLGFQALISATNDKIQNYLENVDKTFVFANPNKKCISVQEFEKNDFQFLTRELAEEDIEEE